MVIKKNKYYVYAHFIPDTDDIFYIGHGNGMRPFEFRKSKRNEEWYRQFVKTGFEVKILYIVDSLKEACDLEIKEIEKAKNKKHKIVNITKGGRGMLGVKPWNAGKKNVFSKESLDKISKAGKKYFSKKENRVKHSIKCGSTKKFQMIKDGIVLWEGYSQKECADKYGLRQGCISKVLHGHAYKHAGYIFKYKDK